MRQVGKIKWFGGYNSNLGKVNNFGFIDCFDGNDVYVHRDNLSFTLTDDHLYEGEVVTFELLKEEGSGRVRYRALYVKQLSNEVDLDVLKTAFLTNDEKVGRLAAKILFPQLSDDQLVELLNQRYLSQTTAGNQWVCFDFDQRVTSILLLPFAQNLREALPSYSRLHIIQSAENLEPWEEDLKILYQNVSSQDWDNFCNSVEAKIGFGTWLFAESPVYTQRKIIEHERNIDSLKAQYLMQNGRTSLLIAEHLFPELDEQEIIDLLETRMQGHKGNVPLFIPEKIRHSISAHLLVDRFEELRSRIIASIRLDLYPFASVIHNYSEEIIACKDQVSEDEWSVFCENIEPLVSASSGLFPYLSINSQERLVKLEANSKRLQEIFMGSDDRVSSAAGERLISLLPEHEIPGFISLWLQRNCFDNSAYAFKPYERKICQILLTEPYAKIRQTLPASFRLRLYPRTKQLAYYLDEFISCRSEVSEKNWEGFFYGIEFDCSLDGKWIEEVIPYGSKLFESAPDDFKRKILTTRFKRFIAFLENSTRYYHIGPGYDAEDLYQNLDDEDYALVEMWGKDEFQDDFHKAKMLSARGAEIVAYWFYQELKMNVENISITQLQNRTAEWKTHDLLVNKTICIDVKNARCPASYRKDSIKRYVEHCVPKFKESRNNQEVIIAGVLSPYMQYRDMERNSPSRYRSDPVIFLGETSWSIIQQLEKRFGKDYFCITNNDKNFVPAWFFEYPITFYSNREKQRKSFRYQLTQFQLPSGYDLELLNVNPYPACLGARMGKNEIRPWFSSLDPWQQKFYDRLSRTDFEVFTLPFLYLVLLTHFLEMLRDENNWKEFHPEGYNKLLFTKPDDTQMPLGIYDPLEIIHNFIDTLSTLWAYKTICKLGSYTSFKFNGKGLLEGFEVETKRRVTILAYCGGKIPGKGNCGKSPLVIGREKTCRCGRLICPDCGYCSDGCPERLARVPPSPPQPVYENIPWNYRDPTEAYNPDLPEDPDNMVPF